MNDLIQLEDIKAPVLFGSDDEVSNVINRIKESAGSIVVSVDTAKGRKETASLAAKVAKSKTYLDGLGKDLVSGIKQQAKEIDGRRKTIRDTLDDLKEEIRKPLTEFENKEKARIAAHERDIDELQTLLVDIPSCSDIGDLAGYMRRANDISSKEFEEYTDAAERAIGKILEAHDKRKAELDLAKKQADELERLRAEAEEREKKEREERIAREAAEAARMEAERKAAREREAEQEALRKAEADKIAAQQAAIYAERREIEAARQAEADKQAAILLEKENAEREAKRVQDEIIAKQAREAAEEKAREADKVHRASVNNKAVNDLVNAGVSVTAAKKAVTAIAKGLVGNVKISY